MTTAAVFEAELFLWNDEAGGWIFVAVPDEVVPPPTHPFGRTPVTATVDGRAWATSVWSDRKSGRTLLAVPKRIRGGKGHGDTVMVALRLRDEF